jgi:hypothetical protein
VARSSTPARLNGYDALLKRLAPPLQDVPPELGERIEAAHPVVRQRHLARQRHVAAADQADIRDRVVRGATGARGDQRRAGAGGAGHAVEAGALDRFGQGHRRQEVVSRRANIDLPAPGEPRSKDVVVTTPASHFASPVPLEMPMDPLLNLPVQLASLCGTIS